MFQRIADGRTDLVFDFVTRGHSPDATDDAGVSLAQWCAYYGDVSALKFLRSHGVSLRALGDNLDLNGAVFHGHWQLCQYLLEHGADANYPLPDTGETPLHAVAIKPPRPSFTHIVRLLLAHGADVRATTTPGVETGGLMRDARTRGETALHRAAAFGDEEVVRLLIDAGADVEARDIHGDTPLAWASWHQRPASILQHLCYGSHRINPGHVALYTGDHGHGIGGMDKNLCGKPHFD